MLSDKQECRMGDFRAMFVRAEGNVEEWQGNRALTAETLDAAIAEALAILRDEDRDANVINITENGIRVHRMEVTGANRT
jgi:hypothetical protein